MMTWVTRGLHRAVHRHRKCVVCGLVVCFVFYWVTAHFECLVKDIVTPPDNLWKTVNNSLRENRCIAAVGGFGTFAADTITMMRLNGYHVLHISPDGATKMNEMKTTRDRTAYDDVTTVGVLLQSYGVNEVDFFYSDSDFTEFRGSRHIGATLRCYVAVLQATVGRDIAINLFLHDARTSRRTGITWRDIRGHNMMRAFKTAQYGAENGNGDESETTLHDVMFHSLRSYLEMYRKMYDLNVTVFMN